MAGVPAVVMNRICYTDISVCIAVVHFSQNGTRLLSVRAVEWHHTRIEVNANATISGRRK